MLTGIKTVEQKSTLGSFMPGNEHIVAVHTFSRTQSLGYKHMRKHEIWFILCVQGEINKWPVSIAYKANKGRKYKKIKYKNYLKIDKIHAKGFDCSNSLPYLTSPNKVIIPKP